MCSNVNVNTCSSQRKGKGKMNGSSSFLRGGRRVIELAPEDVCFDPPSWNRVVPPPPVHNGSSTGVPFPVDAVERTWRVHHDQRDQRRPHSRDGESSVSPMSAHPSSPPNAAISLLQETIHKSASLQADLRRARSGDALSFEQPVASPKPHVAPSINDSEMVRQLHQLVLQHQQRIDQLDEALRVERRAREQLEAVLRQERRWPRGVVGGAGAARVAVEMSPGVASPPKYAAPSDVGSVAELQSVWRELRDEIPPTED